MIWLNWFSGRFGFSNAASVRGKIGSVNPCSSAVKKSRHLNRSPHPQPLSHPMGEGGVGLSPFEAEREKLSASISVCAAGSGGVHPNTAPERGCVPLGAGSATAASQRVTAGLKLNPPGISTRCGWSRTTQPRSGGLKRARVFISQCAGEGLVQQRLLQRRQRGVLPLGEAGGANPS